MKTIVLILFVALASCKGTHHEPGNRDTITIHDTITVVKCDTGKTYMNDCFKDVTVQKLGLHKFLVKGKARVFEAVVSWVVEDGHYELKKGNTMADAGAPAWGNFSFIVDVAKKNENSTLTLILFEASAKDGSRRCPLPIPLY